MRPARRRRGVTAVSALLLLVLTGCARFDDAASSPFSPEPTAGPAEVGPRTDRPPTSTSRPPRPSGPCIDPDPNVVATCLDTTGGIVVLPDGSGALIAERRTGRILRVAPELPAAEIARIDVDGSSDGGLLDLALSPTFLEDGLIYAYITTGSDNRVVRIAAGDTPKPVLEGIPRGATGNAGALDFVNENELVVLTGDAGNPAAAADPGSLAGKLLRLDRPNVGQPATPRVVVSGIGVAGDVCLEPGGTIWVTDRTGVEDRLQKVNPEGAVSSAWTWPDRPGVAGCAAGSGVVAVALTGARAVAMMTVDQGTGSITAAPTLLAQNQYGQLGGATPGPDGAIWVGTVNKTGGEPGPNDDRVVRIPLPGDGGGGPD
nr:PQQ-dependent sugar dehydrogenase [Antrihabitans stalagmiti]